MIADGGYVKKTAGDLTGFLPTGLLPDGSLPIEAVSRGVTSTICEETDPQYDHDVEFIVEGERLLAHRETLAKQCAFFSNMFR